MRLAGRAREARAQATQHIPAAATAHDVLALRLTVLRLHQTLQRITTALEGGGLDAGVVGAGDQNDLDRLAVRRLVELREDLTRSLDDESRTGGRRARAAQLRRVVEVLGNVDAGLKSCATTNTQPESCATTNTQPESCATTNTQPKSCDTYVLTSRDGGLELEAIAGAKAANLAEVGRVLGEESVPAWYAISDGAFQEALETPIPGVEGAPALRAAIDAVLRDPSGTHASRASAIRELWERLTLPEPILDEVVAAYRALGSDCYVAVRSSASDEDTERASRAGQFDTFLFVRGEASVLDHLKLAWSGLWTERALANTVLPAAGLAPHCGVVVQRMVQSRVSGVMQTVNAAEARPLEIVINVGLGLGEGIVSGAVAADLVIVSKGDPRDLALRFRYLTADKRQRVIFDERFGQGTVRADTLAHQRLRPALEYPELRALVDVALRVERAYGHPVDIEFGFEDASLRVLQVRPVPASLAVWHETMESFPLSVGADGKEGLP
jgi:pyruvate,water dikinase